MKEYSILLISLIVIIGEDLLDDISVLYIYIYFSNIYRCNVYVYDNYWHKKSIILILHHHLIIPDRSLHEPCFLFMETWWVLLHTTYTSIWGISICRYSIIVCDGTCGCIGMWVGVRVSVHFVLFTWGLLVFREESSEWSFNLFTYEIILGLILEFLFLSLLCFLWVLLHNWVTTLIYFLDSLTKLTKIYNNLVYLIFNF